MHDRARRAVRRYGSVCARANHSDPSASCRRSGCHARTAGTADSSPAVACDEIDVVLIYSMSVSVDGFIADREDAFGWSVPSEEQFRFHTAQVSEIGGAGLAAAGIQLGLVDELRMFRNPIVVGGGTPFMPPVGECIRMELLEK